MTLWHIVVSVCRWFKTAGGVIAPFYYWAWLFGLLGLSTAVIWKWCSILPTWIVVGYLVALLLSTVFQLLYAIAVLKYPASFVRGVPLTIYFATYGTDSKTRNVTAIIKEKVKDGRLRLAVENDSLGGDPHKNVHKQLILECEWGGVHYRVAFPEHSMMTFPQVIVKTATWKDEVASFVGTWDLGYDECHTFGALLKADMTAERKAAGPVRGGSGSWEYKNGAAHIEWADGYKDVLERGPHGFVKTAYQNGQRKNASTAEKING